MRSIRTKYTLLTVCAIIVALIIATVIGVVSIKNLGNKDAEQMLSLVCTTGAKELDYYFEDVEGSVKTVSSLVQNSLEDASLDQLESQVEHSRDLFGEIAYNTKGVRTYYFRIDPKVSDTVKGFWYVNQEGEGFQEHEVTDITDYDTNDTSQLVWFTVPKATGKGIWLPPYYTENLGELVISYNVPVYYKDVFVGVIGIEIDYAMLAREVENISVFKSGYAFILDEDSNVIYHPQIDASNLMNQDAAAIPDELHSDDKLIKYEFNGVEKEAVWQPLRNGMRLYVTVPVSEFNRSWRDMVWKVILVSIVILVLISLIFLRLTGRLTKPLVELTEAAKQVGQGNYDLELTYNEDDELGNLTKTFEQLIGHTREHIGSLNKKVFIDQLTSIRNRRGYEHYISELQEQINDQKEKVEFAIAVFDCDNLKRINDEYGHEKGDIYLKASTNLICQVFSHSPVFRIGGDEFAVILQNDDYAAMDELFSMFRKTEAGINEAAENPWDEIGITFGLAVYDPAIDLTVVDVARRADQMMYENKRLRKEGNIMTTEDEMALGVNISKYVIENIDRAIENNWIKVYYQPAIRSLTGALCSMESLARWDDPEIGFLTPDQFIGALEKSRQIYKLDRFVVEQACSDLRDRMLQGKPVVPVSINCSRLDFTLCDMVGIVEQAVTDYEIPRKYINIEVTETMIASDEMLMRRVIGAFKEAGYEVWIDDFGSAYSSLTLLKDYQFDLLKLDMNFLTSFNERSKQILLSIILMAKELGMKTLAEGVETKEELDFLKEIGCGKIQGYYYGKPMPIDDMFAHLEEEDVPIETWEQGMFYEKACVHIKPTDAPLEIVEEYDGQFKTLYMNRAYMEQIFSDYPDLEEVDQRIYHTPSPLLQKYHSFVIKMKESLKEETFYYTGASSYLRFIGKVIAEHEGHYLIKGSLINLSLEDDRDKTEELDVRLRELNHVFEAVHLMDIRNDQFIPQIGEYKFLSDYGSEDLGVRGKLNIITEKRIRPDEKNAFANFVDLDTLPERVKNNDRGFVSSVFHVLQKNGGYMPEEIILMPVPGSGGNEYLFCSKLYIEKDYH